ncbi:carboxymuconolactone decarboxylase [Knoellia sinensis KCTC 19936]|uniref:Carboxymuconolactone decarboxylase n=1 Tax=Knoellia sinensis KCTC 19936 TaxID=1385520 RepID=A0A0A0JAD4_9MICO|nr:carboxymuconolactone decarboxylase family protein [Knoellia sinensis]KGN34093.1 carboxymuconolactone decarboxylase [Knoellia sinensis KCTC 19936]
MSTTARIPAAPVDGILGQIVKTMSRRMFGKVPESMGVLWHHKDALKASMAYGRKLDSWDKLDKNLSTYATMAAAATIGCSFCLDFGYFMAHNHGLDETKAREVPRWRESAVFTPVERRVMEYAEAMCQTPVEVTDELSAALLDDLGPAGLVELTTKVGFMNATARGNVALGIHSEEFADACGLAPLATPAAAAVTSSA